MPASLRKSGEGSSGVRGFSLEKAKISRLGRENSRGAGSSRNCELQLNRNAGERERDQPAELLHDPEMIYRLRITDKKIDVIGFPSLSFVSGD
jgi:hypothetical protein